MHKIRREICPLFMNQDSSSTNFCNTATYLYIWHREQRHENKNTTFNHTFHSISLEANNIFKLWWWLIIYVKCNLQGLHHVIWYTKNSLLKSNSVPTPNLTWTHSECPYSFATRRRIRNLVRWERQFRNIARGSNIFGANWRSEITSIVWNSLFPGG
jgi:hypothetical protein